ncbi:MAG TPA: DUF3224 domain-containing protein [Dehalococcoidia bacterium]|nr:DUF3224 domain-containing protein [Dehalococcoidia bacterium]
MTSQYPRRRLLLLSLALATALGPGVAGSARADQPTAAGTWSLLFRTRTLIGTADGNQFFDVVESPAYVGGLTGIAVDTYRLVVHADGSLNAQGIETCAGCTIGGRTGDYTATFSFSAAGSRLNSRLTFQSGSGGLAGLHGGGSFQVTHTTPVVGGTYAYDDHFAS